MIVAHNYPSSDPSPGMAGTGLPRITFRMLGSDSPGLMIGGPAGGVANLHCLVILEVVSRCLDAGG